MKPWIKRSETYWRAQDRRSVEALPALRAQLSDVIDWIEPWWRWTTLLAAAMTIDKMAIGFARSMGLSAPPPDVIRQIKMLVARDVVPDAFPAPRHVGQLRQQAIAHRRRRRR